MFWVTARANRVRLLNFGESVKGKLRSAGIEIPLDTKNFFYLRNWAVSGYERWGLNYNADGWRHKNLSKDYDTFDGAWVCLNHNANDDSDSIGTCLSPMYTEDQYVENMLAINRALADKKHPYLEQDIIDGRVTDTSMGCVARASECTICHNISETDNDYCEHLATDKFGISGKGQKYWVGGKQVVAGELYIDTVFYEDSVLTNQKGADLNAKLFERAAARAGRGHGLGKDDIYYAVKASVREYGSTRMRRLLEAIEKLG